MSVLVQLLDLSLASSSASFPCPPTLLCRSQPIGNERYDHMSFGAPGPTLRGRQQKNDQREAKGGKTRKRSGPCVFPCGGCKARIGTLCYHRCGQDVRKSLLSRSFRGGERGGSG